jgi:hypothetical protein
VNDESRYLLQLPASPAHRDPLTRICEVASEIAYDTLLKDPDLLIATREKYAVRTPECQLEIDLLRGMKACQERGEEGLRDRMVPAGAHHHRPRENF